jgi:hypothetical protein
MSERMFGSGRGCIPDDERSVIDSAIAPFGVVLNSRGDPVNGGFYWLAGPNRGAPSNAQLERDIYAALLRAGITRWEWRSR